MIMPRFVYVPFSLLFSHFLRINLLRYPHTNIGDSEYPGGMKTYCSQAGRYSPQQGQLPFDFWREVAFESGKGKHGKRYAQRQPLLISLGEADADCIFDSHWVYQTREAESVEPR